MHTPAPCSRFPKPEIRKCTNTKVCNLSLSLSPPAPPPPSPPSSLPPSNERGEEICD